MFKFRVGDKVRIKTPSMHCEPVYISYDIDSHRFSCRKDSYAGFEFSERVGERAVGREATVVGVKDFDDGIQFVAVMFWDDEEYTPVVGFSYYTGEEFELVRK